MHDDDPPNERAPAAASVLLTSEGVEDDLCAGGSANSLIRASQLDALDFLASTLVHDLCGPLHNVQLKLSLLQASIAEAEERPETAALHRRCLDYAQAMQQEVGRLLTGIRELPGLFSPPGQESSGEIDVGSLLAEVVRLMTPQCRLRRLRCTWLLPAEALPVEGKRSALRLALLVLFVALVRHARRGGDLHCAARACGDRVEIVWTAEVCPLPVPLPGLLAARLVIESQQGDFSDPCLTDGTIHLQLSLPLRGPPC
ncbi:MAG: hypothetical protein V5B33_19190 [Candidatus Accumulibacter sp. UW20]|jgi:signal transduction histidine kinase